MQLLSNELKLAVETTKPNEWIAMYYLELKALIEEYDKLYIVKCLLKVDNYTFNYYYYKAGKAYDNL